MRNPRHFRFSDAGSPAATPAVTPFPRSAPMDFTTALASWRRAKETADQAEADWLLARLGGCGDEELDALRQVARERWTFALEMLATAQGIIEIRLLRLGCLPGDGLIEQRGPSDVGLAIEPEVIRRLDHVGRAGPDAEPGV